MSIIKAAGRAWSPGIVLLLVSFRRVAMVVALLPLGLIGVVLALLVFNRPLGFVAILGRLALIGMFAKNEEVVVPQELRTNLAGERGVTEEFLGGAPHAPWCILCTKKVHMDTN